MTDAILQHGSHTQNVPHNGYRLATPQEMEDYRRRITAPGAYVIRLRGHSLEPEFRDRDLLLVAPHQDTEHGDFVHVRVNGQKMTK